MNLTKLLDLPDLTKAKIHFAIGEHNRRDPYNAFLNGEFDAWQAHQRKRNFNRPYIISLIYYGQDEWLFAGVYEQTGYDIDGDDYIYRTNLTDSNAELIGRLIVHYNKKYRASYNLAEKYLHEVKISQILKEKASFDKFPGYSNVVIKFNMLKSIIGSQESTWKTALQHLKGIYLLTDTSNGKLYVGSASGEEAFWSRWSSYVYSFHGENKDLRRLHKEKGAIHFSNYFQFSILEAMAPSSSTEDILTRESFWKDVLKSIEFGYNKN